MQKKVKVLEVEHLQSIALENWWENILLIHFIKGRRIISKYDNMKHENTETWKGDVNLH